MGFRMEIQLSMFKPTTNLLIQPLKVNQSALIVLNRTLIVLKST